MSTGSARRITHFMKPDFIFENSFWRTRLNKLDLANLPSAAKPSLKAMPISEMVGGPPTNTLVGIARFVTVGSSIIFFSCCFSRGGLSIPATWQASTGTYANFGRELSGDAETLLGSVPRRQRAEVRRALTFDLESTSDTDRRHRDAHYRVYAESVRNLGTPVFPRRLFEAMLDAFGDEAWVNIIWKDGRPLAALLGFNYGDRCCPYWGGGTREARQWRANDLIYYEMMRRALEAGCIYADFGRSKIGTGPWERKRIWGLDETVLTYAVRTADGEAPRSVNPLDPKYARRIAAWQKLPLWAANRIGPLISRGLG